MKEAYPNLKRVYFIGIGGAGMSAIANWLLAQGTKVSGSDLIDSPVIDDLRARGAEISTIQDGKFLRRESTLVVYSSAIKKSNREIKKAKELGLPILSRGHLLSYLLEDYQAIATVGSHGKTTTAGLLVAIFKDTNPNYLIGGWIYQSGSKCSNWQYSEAKEFIVELDESDGSFLYTKAGIVIITGIDQDHLNSYQNNFRRLQEAFGKFIQGLPKGGKVIYCHDDHLLLKAIQSSGEGLEKISYGISKEADFQLSRFKQKGLISEFTVKDQKRRREFQLRIRLPGIHNALNATAVFALGIGLGFQGEEQILSSLSSFHGVRRRFEYLGKYTLGSIGFEAVFDYAHHPTALELVLHAIKQVWPNRSYLVLFQPHRHTRLEALFYDFAKVLKNVERLMLLPLYSAGENPSQSIDSSTLLEEIKSRNCGGTITLVSPKLLEDKLSKSLKDGDILVALGAGDIHEHLKKFLQTGPCFFIT